MHRPGPSDWPGPASESINGNCMVPGNNGINLYITFIYISIYIYNIYIYHFPAPGKTIFCCFCMRLIYWLPIGLITFCLDTGSCSWRINPYTMLVMGLGNKSSTLQVKSSNSRWLNHSSKAKLNSELGVIMVIVHLIQNSHGNQQSHTHRIHGAGIYANIWGILMGSMLPYIPAPWILWDM